MSIFSDYKVGALSDWEFEQEGRRMNREDRWEREHEYDDERISKLPSVNPQPCDDVVSREYLVEHIK